MPSSFVRVTDPAKRRLPRSFTPSPLTSNTSRVYDFQVLLPALATGLAQDSKAQAEQIRSVDISRLSQKPTGKLPSNLMQKVDDALKLHLAL